MRKLEMCGREVRVKHWGTLWIAVRFAQLDGSSVLQAIERHECERLVEELQDLLLFIPRRRGRA